MNMVRSKKAKVLTYHTLVEEYGRVYAGKAGAMLMRRRSKAVCNKMDVVITPSKIIKKKLLSYGVKKPIHPIPTGIKRVEKYFTKKELHEEFNIPKSKKILLSVGRICKEKNMETLLKIMKDISEKDKDLFLLLIGPGESTEFKKIAKDLKIADKVLFTGPLPMEKVQKSYGGADAFVFASKTDTQALVVGEAMMAKTPVIALKSQIIPDVYPLETLFCNKNKKEFVDSVFEVLKNKKKREEKVKKAKDFVEDNFSRRAMTKKQTELFSSLI
jgi:glycosyltransferase involved in cell wall biosynthesis